MNKLKLWILLLLIGIFVSFVACNESDDPSKNVEPRISQMKTISELAAMNCYYHNVAKYEEKNASGMLLWKKDKRFWIEYSGVVKIGIDASLLNVEVDDTIVTISIPNAKVLDKKVDEASLTKDSFIVDAESADIDGEDEIKAFAEAQEIMAQAAASDTALLANAQRRVEKLLEEYIFNIGSTTGKEYTIEWKYINDEDGDSEESDDE